MSEKAIASPRLTACAQVNHWVAGMRRELATAGVSFLLPVSYFLPDDHSLVVSPWTKVVTVFHSTLIAYLLNWITN